MLVLGQIVLWALLAIAGAAIALRFADVILIVAIWALMLGAAGALAGDLIFWIASGEPKILQLVRR